MSIWKLQQINLKEEQRLFNIWEILYSRKEKNSKIMKNWDDEELIKSDLLLFTFKFQKNDQRDLQVHIIFSSNDEPHHHSLIIIKVAQIITHIQFNRHSSRYYGCLFLQKLRIHLIH